MGQQSERRGAAESAGASSERRESLVVGIGASAGGLPALRTLLSGLPPAPEMAFVVVVHLSPEHESHLAALLQPSTAMPVRQVTTTVLLEPNHVYVIPPNANLSSIDTHLRLSELEDRRLDRAPIDHFFRTLAASHDGSSVGVVLTGGGSDGALGLRLIKERGGLTIAQHPEEAEYAGMPRSAIATGMVDVVARLADIPGEIVRWAATRPRVPIPAEHDPIDERLTGVVDEILREVEASTQRELGLFKPAMVLRRVRRRMRVKHVETLPQYLDVLRSHGGEPQALADDLMLAVTEFFRGPELFERLERSVVPELFATKRAERDRLRVWSLGCSTGEEAYSLAMLLLEEAARRETRPKLQVFASDLSDELLRRARDGLYPREIAAAVSPARLERFFEEQDGHYRVRRDVRAIVIFAAHNVLRDPPYAHLGLIVCRNLLSDLQPEVRRALIGMFHYALEPNGFLVLGTRDELDEPQLFASEDGREQIFRRKAGPARDLALPRSLQRFRRGHGGAEGADSPGSAALAGYGGITTLHLRLLERHAPPSLLVDDAGRVLRFSANAGRYVRMPGGSPTRDVMEIVREPLRARLQEALTLVRGDQPTYSSEPFALQTEGGARRVTLRVERVVDAELSLVVVRELDEDAHETLPSLQDQAVLALEVALARARRRLLQVTTAGDHSERRLALASNEDLQSLNEELRFMMEELDSSKEELQASNEELATLDDQNRQRITELWQISSDLQHLLESTGVATLFLDRDANILRFTPQAGALFNVTLRDRGRPLSDLNHRLAYDDLAGDVRRVATDGSPVEREVAGANGRWYLARLAVYAANETDQGAALTLIDITERKRAELELRESERRKDEFLAVLAHELRNPLAPILSGIDVLTMAGDDPRIVAEVAATMGRQTQQLVRLVDDLLDVSRLTSGRLRLRKAKVALGDVLRDAVAAVQPLVAGGGHELVLSVPSEPIMLDADSARLTQVFANLLNNAARYTSAGGRIEIAAWREHATVVVAVRDNGSGIPPEKIGYVFEMFYQATDERSSRSAGLGIGLTLARSLVEMHGGAIDVESEGLGHGSTFTVRLPAAAAGTADAPTSPPEDGLAAIHGHRVLIVDDNVDAAQTLSLAMRQLGDNEIHVASSGAAALETAAVLRPDVVVLDLKMPEMDGYEVARRIRAAPWGKEIFLVALTGWAQEDHKRRTKEAGFDRHLTKPADQATLRAALREIPPASGAP